MKRSPAPLKTAREKNKGRTKATLPNKRIESNPIQRSSKTTQLLLLLCHSLKITTQAKARGKSRKEIIIKKRLQNCHRTTTNFRRKKTAKRSAIQTNRIGDVNLRWHALRESERNLYYRDLWFDCEIRESSVENWPCMYVALVLLLCTRKRKRKMEPTSDRVIIIIPLMVTAQKYLP